MSPSVSTPKYVGPRHQQIARLIREASGAVGKCAVSSSALSARGELERPPRSSGRRVAA